MIVYWNKKYLFYFFLFIFSTNTILFLSRNKQKKYKIFVNYNGQADILLSLKIFPDYYPYQFKKKKLYKYLDQTSSYIVANDKTSEKKKKISKNFQSKINLLLSKVSEFDEGLWNNELYESGLITRNNEFWNNKETEYLIIEQFIADDYINSFDSVNFLPKHKKLITTNFRVASDPFTIFSKETFDFFKQKKENLTKTNSEEKKPNNNQFNEKFYKYYKNFNQITSNSLYRSGQFIDFWNENLSEISDNLKSTTSQVVPSKSSETEEQDNNTFDLFLKQEKLFDVSNEDNDKKIAEKYIDNLFSQEEKTLLNSWSENQNWKANYLIKKKSNIKKPETTTLQSQDTKKTKSQLSKYIIKNFHHPSLEHQKIKGSAPLSEGSQKEIMLYLYQFAKLLDNISKDSNFETVFQNDERKETIKKAMENAKKIAKNYKERIKNIRAFFQKINVIDSKYKPEEGVFTKTSSKNLLILTYPPNSFGGGDASVQSISKFPFIYRDLGFNQVFPSNQDDNPITNPSNQSIISSFSNDDLSNDDNDHDNDHDHDHDTDDIENEEVFSVDDNGWWWNLGNANLSKNHLKKFKNKADSIIFLSTPDDWLTLKGGSSPKLNAFYQLLKDTSKTDIKNKNFNSEYINKPFYPMSYSEYNLWNEGLRSPIAINLLLDNLVEIIKNTYQKDNNNIEEYKKAQDWGNYWETIF